MIPTIINGTRGQEKSQKNKSFHLSYFPIFLIPIHLSLSTYYDSFCQRLFHENALTFITLSTPALSNISVAQKEHTSSTLNRVKLHLSQDSEQRKTILHQCSYSSETNLTSDCHVAYRANPNRFIEQNLNSLCLAQKECGTQTVCFLPLSQFKSKCMGQGDPVYRALAHVLGLQSSSEQYGPLWQLLRYDACSHSFIYSSRGSTTPAPAQEGSLGAHGRASYLPTHTSFCMTSSTCTQSLPAALVGCLSRLCCQTLLAKTLSQPLMMQPLLLQ